MQIRYVVSTMVFWWRENHLSFEQECQFLRSLGYGVELRPVIRGEDECRYERWNWSRLVSVTGGMLVSMRSRTDGPTLEQWKEQIECAKLLGAHIVADTRSLGIPDGPELNGCGFTADVVKLAEANGVTLCLETGSLPVVREIGERFDSVRYCFDTGWANLDRQFGFKQYVDELAERTVHVHLSDNYGHVDDHEPPGLSGGISRESWDYLLNGLGKYDNEVVASFEMFPSMPAVMIRQASEFLFGKLGWPNQPVKQPAYAAGTYNPL